MPFSWSKNSLGHNLIQVRLDRVLLSTDWDILPYTSLHAFPRTISSHFVLLFNWMGKRSNRKEPLRCEIMWHYHPQLRDSVTQWWNIGVQGTSMFYIARKLENIRKEVIGWRKSSFGDIFKKNKEIEDKLEEI